MNFLTYLDHMYQECRYAQTVGKDGRLSIEGATRACSALHTAAATARNFLLTVLLIPSVLLGYLLVVVRIAPEPQPLMMAQLAEKQIREKRLRRKIGMQEPSRAERRFQA